MGKREGGSGEGKGRKVGMEGREDEGPAPNILS